MRAEWRALARALWLEHGMGAASRRRAAVGLLALAALAGPLVPGKALWLALPAAHPLSVVALIGLADALIVQACLRRARAWAREGWLSAAPIGRFAWRLALAWQVLVPSIALPCLLAAAVGSAAIAQPGVRGDAIVLLGTLAAAVPFGLITGAWLAREPARTGSPSAAVRARADAAARLAPLAGWSAAQARALLPPRLLTRALTPVMLALPMDVPGPVAIATLVACGLLAYLLALLLAWRTVLHAAPEWLGATPCTPARLVWTITRAVAWRQLLWTVVLGGVLIALGARPAMVLRLLEAWSACVMLAGGAVLSARAPARRARLLAGLAGAALLERLEPHWVAPFALLYACAQLLLVRA